MDNLGIDELDQVVIPDCSLILRDQLEDDLETKLLKMLNIEQNTDEEKEKEPVKDDKQRSMKLKYSDGSEYQGEVIGEKMLRHGQGLLQNIYVKDQKVTYKYEGNFAMDKFEGQGELTVWDSEFTEVIQYKGQFNQGQFQGYGDLTTKYYKYQGEFRMGIFHGSGKMIIDFNDLFAMSLTEYLPKSLRD